MLLFFHRIHRFWHDEITVYIVGIILTFMTYVLVFHWYGSIFQVNISQWVDWFATFHTPANAVDQRNWYFLWYLIFLFYCVILYNFWQLTLIDEVKIYLLPFPCHQGMSWPTGWMNHVLPLTFVDSVVFSFHAHLFCIFSS